MDEYREICTFDSEIKFNFDFGDFHYDDLISFCAALRLVADYYNIILIRTGIFSIEYDVMVQGISKLAGLTEEKVKKFLKYQTYDYDYQKDKLTLFQPLILCNDRFYFLPLTISLGLLPVKMYKVMVDNDKKHYRKEVSNEKEKQMTTEIVDKLKKYDLQIETNYKLCNKNDTIAEYDMLVFDNKTRDLYIFEFKWHFIGDGEEEHKFIDDMLESEIMYRIEKDKFIKEKQQRVCNELFNSDNVNAVKEILISQNFGGNTKHSMTVIDFETLKRGVDRFESFKELMDWFLSGKYLSSVSVENIKTDIELEGYKFSIFLLKSKVANR